MSIDISAILAEALEDLILQDKGLKNNWCGMWSECTNQDCKQEYAKGGNWTVSLGEDELGPCHICRAKSALALYEIRKLSIPHASVREFAEKLPTVEARNKENV